jgi:hypothetical protein
MSDSVMQSIDESIAKLRQVAPDPFAHRRHPERFRLFPTTEVDTFRVCSDYGVTDPTISFAIEMLLLAGKQGRPEQDDIMDAIDALARCLEIRAENTQRILGGVAGNPFSRALNERARQVELGRQQGKSDQEIAAGLDTEVAKRLTDMTHLKVKD